MKSALVWLAAVVVVVAGCRYAAPLVEEAQVPVDPQVLGLWQGVPDEGEEPDEDERMLVLAYSDTEYLVHYPFSVEDGMYFRAYPIEIGETSCVQIRLAGTTDGPPEEEMQDRYDVVSYAIEGDTLTLRTLNSELVDKEVKLPVALRHAFEQNQDNPELFTNPARFRRVEEE